MEVQIFKFFCKNITNRTEKNVERCSSLYLLKHDENKAWAGVCYAISVLLLKKVISLGVHVDGSLNRKHKGSYSLL